jgi:hypothetical protein
MKEQPDKIVFFKPPDMDERDPAIWLQHPPSTLEAKEVTVLSCPPPTKENEPLVAGLPILFLHPPTITELLAKHMKFAVPPPIKAARPDIPDPLIANKATDIWALGVIFY